MSEILEDKVFNHVREMNDDDKNQILETCFSSSYVVEASIDYLFRLQDWFDVYVCSDKFTSLSAEQKKDVVKDFRGLYDFLDVLNVQMR